MTNNCCIVQKIMIAYFVKIQATKEHEYEIDEIDKISF